jgi:hypothetical protein
MNKIPHNRNFLLRKCSESAPVNVLDLLVRHNGEKMEGWNARAEKSCTFDPSSTV